MILIIAGTLTALAIAALVAKRKFSETVITLPNGQAITLKAGDSIAAIDTRTNQTIATCKVNKLGTPTFDDDIFHSTPETK